MEKFKGKKLAINDQRSTINDQRSTINGGFTLIEVLIVVVIIGVLAALIIPRMLAQTEKAKMAEAFQILGALNRAEQAYLALNGATDYLYVCAQGGCGPGTYAQLGVQTPTWTNFIYNCGGVLPNSCRAMRQPWPASASSMELREDSTWNCVGGLYKNGTTSTDPCVLA